MAYCQGIFVDFFEKKYEKYSLGTIGERIKEFRESLGMRQEDLANALGVKKQFISNIETGERGLSMETIQTLARMGADLNHIFSSKGNFVTPNGNEQNGHTVLVPLYPQKVSAGSGQDWLSVEPIGAVPALESLIRPWKGKDVRAVEVEGDSMTGVNLFEGDIVFFKPGLVTDAGIYVISHAGRLRIKRLEFKKDAILIHSENPRYSSDSEPVESQDLIILGKVLGWFHRHPY